MGMSSRGGFLDEADRLARVLRFDTGNVARETAHERALRRTMRQQGGLAWDGMMRLLNVDEIVATPAGLLRAIGPNSSQRRRLAVREDKSMEEGSIWTSKAPRRV